MSVIVNESIQSVVVQEDRPQVIVDEILQAVVVQESPTEIVVRTAWPEGARKGANTDITSMSGITGAISEPDSIQFDIDAGVTVVEGQIAWNQDYSTVDVGMNGGSVIQHVGFHSYYRIKASAAITKGQLVMFTGAVGASGVLTGAPTNSLTSGLLVMGVASSNIANNAFGEITAFGLVRGFDTTGGAENWQQGDILYYDPSVAGGLTKVAPTAPTPRVVVASVVNPGPGGSGSIFVRPTFEPKLNELTDVSAVNPSAGSTLIYDATQTRWEAATLTAGDNVTITNNDGAITIAASGASAGVDSFNTRTGAVTLSSQDVTDALTFTPVNKAGDTMTGKLTLPATTGSAAPLNIGQGTAPVSSVAGDIWLSSTFGLQYRSSGGTYTIPALQLANTFSTGAKQTFTHSSGQAGVRIAPSTATAPSSLSDGDIWHRTSDAKLSVRLGGSSKFLLTEDAITSSMVTTALGYTPINATEKGAANGVATLGADTKIPSAQLPAIAITDTFVVASEAAMIALSSAEKGDVAVRTDLNKSFILTADPYSTLANWQELLTPTDAVLSVNGQTGAVSLSASDVSAVPTTRNVSTGTGLSGGGDLSTDRTLSLADTTVSANSYGSATQVATFTVDAQGRLTAASNATIAIANTAVSGLGTMSTQDANNIAVTGGSVGAITYKPASTATPANNGDMVFELTDDTTLTIKVKGSDGNVRLVALTLTATAESFLRLE